MTTSADDNQGRIGTTLLGFRPRPKSDAINVAPECSLASAIAAPLSESCSRALPSTGLLPLASADSCLCPEITSSSPLSGPLKSLHN